MSIIILFLFAIVSIFLTYSSTQEKHDILNIVARLLNHLPFSLFESLVVGALGTVCLYICFGTPQFIYKFMSPKIIRRIRKLNLTRGICISYIFASIAGALIGAGVGAFLYYQQSFVNKYLALGLIYVLLSSGLLMFTSEVPGMRIYLKKGGILEFFFRTVFGIFGLICLVQTVPAWRIIG